MQKQAQKERDQRFETTLWSLLIHAGLIGLLLIPVLLNYVKTPPPQQDAIQWLGDGSEGLPAEGGSMPGDGNALPPPPPPPDEVEPLPPPPPPPPDKVEHVKSSNLEDKAEEADEKSASEVKVRAEELKKKLEVMKKKQDALRKAEEKKRLDEKKKLADEKRLADEKKRKEASDLKNRLANAKKTDAKDLRSKVYSDGRSASDIAKSLKSGTGGGGTGTPGSRLGIKGGTGPGGGSTTGSADVAYDQLLQALCEKLWVEPSLTEMNNQRPAVPITITIGSNGKILNAVISVPSGVAAMDSSVRRVCDRLLDQQLPPFVNFKISGTVITKQLELTTKRK